LNGRTATAERDGRLAAINARWQASRANSDTPQFSEDVAYLLARLQAAERAAMAGAAYHEAVLLHLRDSFARTCTADARAELRAALAEWRATVATG
jgi:hypothetical protein